MITVKPWGTTECVVRTPFVEAHRITVQPNGECSWHKHERKWNAFIVATGLLYITTETAGTVGYAWPGAIIAVRPNECHKFRAGGDGAIAIELYYPAELSEDIVRYNVSNLEDAA